MGARRSANNPILTPRSVRASQPGLDVVGVFNPGVTRQEDDIVLLLRVAEAPPRVDGEVSAPVYDATSGRVDVRRWPAGAPGLDASDPRVIVVDGRVWLTSLSHLRLARSRDGTRFQVEPEPALSPATELEAYGIEDPRITLLDGTYWINYTAVSEHGIATALASTRDFRSFERHGVIFPPPNRDVTLFPERIGGRYIALHRPMPEGPGEPSIWLARSDDLLAWGDHAFVAGPRPGSWDDAKVGGGAVPFRVAHRNGTGWLALYHGVSRSGLRYALGALLLDAGDPERVLARSREPVLAPDADYERHGFFGGVVFTCGALAKGDVVRVYYGAADGVTAVADLSLDEIMAGLERP